MLPDLTRRLLRQWDEILPEIAKPRHLTYLCVAGSPDGGTTTFLAFDEKGPEPLFAVKIHRHGDSKRTLIRERGLLEYLHSLGGDIGASVPKALACIEIERTWLLVQSILPGRPILGPTGHDETTRLHEAAADFKRVTEWLVMLRTATKGSLEGNSGAFAAAARARLKSFTETYRLNAAEQQQLEAVESNMDTIASLGAFLQHGDFCRHNILRSNVHHGLGLSVIDWTQATTQGVALHDVFFFAGSYSQQTRQKAGVTGMRETFAEAFMRDGEYATLVARSIQSYCKAVELDHAHAKLLFAIFLVDKALAEHEQTRECSEHGPLPRVTLFIAGSEKKGLADALTSQVWFEFFRAFVEYHGEFLRAGRRGH